jgi:hypothetical protein
MKKSVDGNDINMNSLLVSCLQTLLLGSVSQALKPVSVNMQMVCLSRTKL